MRTKTVQDPGASYRELKSRESVWVKSGPDNRMGDIIPLSQTWTTAPLIPRYCHQADPKLTSRNSLEFSTEFYLNSFFDKELYYFILQNDS